LRRVVSSAPIVSPNRSPRRPAMLVDGYEYVRVDDDIVLMLTATRVIAAVLGNLGSFD